ncbi:MAG: glycosyltransferase family 4 protein [Gammaproteobacteria bacterium]|nr:glycosyltransferase family 4 protein [Gammaproteobacteria bacterium]
MKIIIIASYAPSIINFRKSLVSTLAENHTVIVLAPWEDEKTADEIRALGVIYQPIFLNSHGMSPWKDMKSFFALIKIVKQYKPDILFSYTIKPVIWGSLAAHYAGVKNIYALITGLGYAFTEAHQFSRKILYKIVVFLYSTALSCNRTVFFQNPDDQKLFKKLKMISENKKSIVINGSGVDLSYYAFSTISTDKPIRFLLIARLLKDKGLIEYVEAAKIIKQKYSDSEFHLVGYIDDNPAAISQSLLDKWTAEESIIFHGKLQDVRPVIQLSSVYVLPSYREGTPRSVLEAMSMGRAVISTDAPGCRETVTDGYNGYLVPIKNINALVAAMEKFIRDPESIHIMGLASRKLAEKKYDVHKVNKVILAAMGLMNSDSPFAVEQPCEFKAAGNFGGEGG